MKSKTQNSNKIKKNNTSASASASCKQMSKMAKKVSTAYFAISCILVITSITMAIITKDAFGSLITYNIGLFFYTLSRIEKSESTNFRLFGSIVADRR